MALAGIAACKRQSEPHASGAFAFGVFADGPYSGHEVPKAARMMDLISRHDLAWVLNVGDILWYPCSDALIERRFQMFQKIRHPFIYTPGDNEWSDCHGRWEGNFEPLDRLRKLREVFYPDPLSSTGGRAISLRSQRDSREHSEFVEHARWVLQDVVFTTIHVVGGRNGRMPFPGRTSADDEEASRREKAAIAWMEESFAEARSTGARALVLALHADMSPGEDPGDPVRDGFEPILESLEEEAAEFERPVLLIHGDSHTYIVDTPLVRRSTHQVLTNVTRLEVPGSPEIGWVKVTVEPEAGQPFTFERLTVRLGAVWW